MTPEAITPTGWILIGYFGIVLVACIFIMVQATRKELGKVGDASHRQTTITVQGDDGQ